MKHRKILLTLIILLATISAASAQNIEVEGLEEKNVQTEFSSDSIRFTTDYMNQSLTPRQIYVPDELDNTISFFSWSFDSWSENESVSSYSMQYKIYSNGNPYPNDKLSRVLGGNPNVAQSLPQNQFASYNSSYSTVNEPELGQVFTNKLEDSDKSSIYWDIKISSRYEHLVVDYELNYRYENNTVGRPFNNVSTKTIYSSQDVYSDDEPDFVPIKDGKIEPYTNEKGYYQQQSIKIDNKYGSKPQNYTVLLAYNKSHEFNRTEFSFDEVKYASDLNATKVYENAEDQVINQGLNQSLLISNKSEYRFRPYNITVPADEVAKFSSTLSTSSSVTSAGHKMYVLGSIGGTTTYSSGGGASGIAGEYDKYKELEAVNVNGDPIVSITSPVIITCGDDTSTGQGDIVIDCSNVDTRDDIAITDENDNTLDYQWEQFQADTGGKSILWAYNSWSRDGTVQAKIYYGGGSTDYSNSGTGANPYNNGQNALMVQYFEDDPISATDETDNNYDGSVENADSITGYLDGAAKFDGASNDGIEVSLNMDTSSTGLTIQSVFQWYSYYDNQRGFRKGPSSSNNHGFSMFSSSEVKYEWSDAQLSNYNINYDQWYHTTLVVGTGTSPTLDAYYESSLYDSATGNHENTGGTLGIGKAPDDDTYIPGNLEMDGAFSVLRYYEAEKDQDWIESSYDATPNGGQSFFSQNSGQSVNSPPSINDITTSEFNWNIGVSQDIYADVTDPDGNLDTVTYDVIDPQGNTDYSGSLTLESGDNYTASNAFTVDERGEWELEIRAEDTAGAFEQSNTVQNVNPPKSDIIEPVNEEIGSNPVQFNFTPTCYTDPNVGFPCSSAQLYLNESGTWQMADSVSQPQNNTEQTLNYNITNSGTYEWDIKVIDAKDRYAFDPSNNTFTLSLNDPPLVENLTINPPSPVPTETSTDLTVESEDGDGSVTEAEITLTNPQGVEKVSNAQMSELNSVTTTQPWRYTYSHEELPENLGQWTVDITVTDDDGATDTTSSTYQVEDGTPPKYYDYADNVSGLMYSEDYLEINSTWNDNGTGLSKVFLSTNETGQWKNYTASINKIDSFGSAINRNAVSGNAISDIDVGHNTLYEAQPSTLFGPDNPTIRTFYTNNLSSKTTFDLTISPAGVAVNETNEDIIWVSNETFVYQYNLSGGASQTGVRLDRGYTGIDIENGELYGKSGDYVYIHSDPSNENFRKRINVGTPNNPISVTEDKAIYVMAQNEEDIRIFDSVSGQEYESVIRPRESWPASISVKPEQGIVYMDESNSEDGSQATNTDIVSYNANFSPPKTVRSLDFANITQEFNETSFVWTNTSFKGDLGYRVWAKDAADNYNVTSTNVQKVAKKYQENARQNTVVDQKQSDNGVLGRNFISDISLTDKADGSGILSSDFLQNIVVTDVSVDRKVEFQNVIQDIAVTDEESTQIDLFRNPIQNIVLDEKAGSNISLSRQVLQTVTLQDSIKETAFIDESIRQSTTVAVSAIEQSIISENLIQNIVTEEDAGTNTSFGREIVQEAGIETGAEETSFIEETQIQAVNVGVTALEQINPVENPVQNIALTQSAGTNTDLGRAVQQFQILNQKTRQTAYLIENPTQEASIIQNTVDIWNPFVDAQQETGVETGVDTDLGIFENFQELITVDSSLSNNTGPRELNTTIYGESLGASNYSTTVQVKVRDFEGGNISSVTINDVTQEFPGNETTEVANITIGNVKEYTGGIQATDSRGVTRDINFGFEISDNPYIQTTSSVNLTNQDINKTDTVTNLQESEYDFYYRLSHSSLGQEATSENSWKGNIVPGETGQEHTTDFYGDFLIQDTNDWVQNLNKTSTDEQQYIRRTFEINSLTGDDWENVQVPSVPVEDGFSPCEICSRNPISFTGDFEDKTFYTDSGDIINTQLTGTIGDFVIGERDTYFEQYRYTQTVENGLTLQDIQVQETVNDTGFNYGSFLNVEKDDDTYGNELLEVKETVSCTTSMPSFSTGQFNNQDWKACSQDVNGNTQPEVFKVVIPVISKTTYNEEIRLGGFTGEPPEDEIDPFPGLQTECENGETQNDLICVRDQWRTKAQATRQLSIANSEAGQVGESLGLLAGLVGLVYLFGLWRDEKDEN